MTSPFFGRSIQVVRDLSVDEQAYLYDRTRALKEALQSRDRESIARFVINADGVGAYLFFMEDSTRTKESFRNAVKFHGLKLNDFGTSGSSFNKSESITDTFRMLVSYSDHSLFVVRTKLEGACRWLEESIGAYAERLGLQRPSFINAGDGRHEHPTQEFLDEFTFLEQAGWDRSSIHVALVGDLYHGRTAHSKVDGLSIFNEVRVDLVAPDELEMPPHYVSAMEAKGYDVRRYQSIAEYLAGRDVAPTWYFTRLQIERMGDRLLDRAAALRDAVTFRRDFLSALPDGARFYHPLPRHRVTPTIPTFLDDLPVNGWAEQSINGYYTRIIEIAMLAGHLGADFVGTPRVVPDYPDDFVREVSAQSSRKPDYKIGIKPVDRGIVIDHIGRGGEPADIWNQIDKIRRILGLNLVSSHGVYSSRSGHYKGIVSLPTVDSLTDSEMKTLGAAAPGCTLNRVEDGRVVRKYRMEMPPRIYNLPGIACSNEECISHPSHHEPVDPEFLRSGADRYLCKYCERPHEFGELW
ncbi:MAG: aspartate carbamoyltransferase [Spirochaetaceae bacterium]|nr:MAG: aspartate carbamoyltransferase [Spirochaetaceae bacterium]